MFKTVSGFSLNPKLIFKYLHQKQQKSSIVILWIFSLFILSLDQTWARLPDPNTNTSFKELIALSLAEHLSSFQYEGEELEDTYVVGFHQHSDQAFASRSKQELFKILMNEKTKYKPKKTSYAGRLSANLYEVILPKGSVPHSFYFSLTPLPGYTNEEISELGLPLLDSRNKLSLRLKLNAILQNYERDRKLSTLLDQIKELELAIKSETQADKRFILESQRSALRQEVISISNPVEKLRYIIENISPMGFRDYPIVVFLQVLQEAKLIDPPLTQEALSTAKKPETSLTALGSTETLTSPEVKNCVDLGGVIEVYTKGKSQEALLCRFGEAGIGANSLYQFKNKESIKSISAYLNFIPYMASVKEQAAIIPVGKTEDGKPSGFVLSNAQAPKANLEPALKLILNPSVKVSEYCRQREGKPTQLHHQKDGAEFKACIFDDFSGIDAKTLFAGPEDPVNSQLTRVLRSMQ